MKKNYFCKIIGKWKRFLDFVTVKESRVKRELHDKWMNDILKLTIKKVLFL